MFERFTEKARRTIFFARYEASHFGSPYITPELLLLGLLRERKNLFGITDVEPIANQVRSQLTVGEKFSASLDLPISHDAKRVLAYAAEEAERLSHQAIATDHLVLGFLREPGRAKDVLESHGLDLINLRASAKVFDGEPNPLGPEAASLHHAVDLLDLQDQIHQISRKLDKLLEELGG